MKKLFFTAIALVAFSGISMASTIDDANEIKNQNKNDLKKNVISLNGRCDGMAAAMMSIYEDNHGCVHSASVYNKMYNIYYKLCLRLTA